MFLSSQAAWVQGYTPTRPEHIHMNLPLTNYCMYYASHLPSNCGGGYIVGGRKAQASPYLGTLVAVGACVMFTFHVSQNVVHVLQDLFLRREQ